MLIDFKQFPRLLKFIGLLKFETCVYCAGHIFDKIILYYFRCDGYFLLSDKTTFNTGCLLNNPFCHIYAHAHAQGATPSHTKQHPKKLLETYCRIPSRRGHATSLFLRMLPTFLQARLMIYNVICDVLVIKNEAI